MRRSSSLSSFLFLLAAAGLAYIYLHGMRSPKERRAFETPPHERRSYRRGEYTRHEAETPANCGEFGTACASQYFASWTRPGNGTCSTSLRHGYPVPDPRCTPGGINPTVTADVLKNPAWRTGCVRNCATSEAKKHVTYRWYGLHTPRKNFGKHQVCELDHLVPLELGGADGLGNIWPECGPSRAALDSRYFKLKDRVENYLADEVRSGKMPLAAAQRGIAADWTQYLDAANRYCAAGGRCN